jgi:hypothetical protein
MTNSPNNRLDEFIKETMKNYEVPYNEAHWQEFESQLNAQPRNVSSFNWKFSLNTILIITAAGIVSAFVYASVSHSSDKKQDDAVQQNTLTKNIPVNNTVQPNENKDAVTNGEQDVVTNNTSGNNNSVFTSSDLSSAGNNSADVQSNDNSKSNTYSLTGGSNYSSYGGFNKNTNPDASIDPKELQKQLSEGEKDKNGMPLYFPDMIDKRKGFIYPTKESDTIKEKAEKNNLNSPFFTTDPTGNPVLNTEALKNFLNSTKGKGQEQGNADQQEKKNTAPTDSSLHANEH